MATDILKELHGKKPFREIEIPKELLENILLIPAELRPCPNAPIIKIERKLSCEQVKEMVAYEEIRQRRLNQAFGVDATRQRYIPTLKESLIMKDFHLLGELVATNYYSKFRKITDRSNLYQVVEIDWSMKDFCPNGQDIHYEVFTKREIRIREIKEA